MAKKLWRFGFVVAALTGTYLGLIVLFWVLINFRLSAGNLTLDLVSAMSLLVSLIVLGTYFVVLLINLIPPMVLDRLGVRSGWAYLLTFVPSWMLFATLFIVMGLLEEDFRAILPHGPRVYTLDPTIFSAENYFRLFARAFTGQFLHDPLKEFRSWHTASELAVFILPGILCPILYWLFAVRCPSKRAKTQQTAKHSAAE